MPDLVYAAPQPPDDAELAAAIAADDVIALSEMVIGVTAYGDDRDRAVALVRRLVGHPHENVRGNAVLGIGHTARRFGPVPPDLLQRLPAALADPSAYVRAHAGSAADDVHVFLGVDVRGSD